MVAASKVRGTERKKEKEIRRWSEGEEEGPEETAKKKDKLPPQLEAPTKMHGEIFRVMKNMMKRRNGRKSSETDQKALQNNLDLALCPTCATSQTPSNNKTNQLLDPRSQVY